MEKIQRLRTNKDTILKNHKKPHSKAIRNTWEGMQRMGKATLVKGEEKTVY